MPSLDNTALEVLENIEEAAAKAQEAGGASGGTAAQAQIAEARVNIENELIDGIQNGTLQELGSYEGEQISSARILSGEGRSLRRQREQNLNNPRYLKKLAEVAGVYRRTVEGRLRMEDFMEMMMTTDFPALFGDTIDRIMLAKYASYEPATGYRRFMRPRSVRDFRPVHTLRRTGLGLLNEVREGANYPMVGTTEEYFQWAVKKYGAKTAMTFEMMVNDDLDAFGSIPQDFARAATNTEMYLASSNYVGNTVLYGNHVVKGKVYSNLGNAPLSHASLKAAINTMVQFPGDEGVPLLNSPVFLVTGPALQITAREILGSPALIASGGDSTDGAGAILSPSSNVLNGFLEHVVDPMIPVLDPVYGHTSWHLFSDPDAIHAAEYGFLRGYEAPQLFMSNGGVVALGGGSSVIGGMDDDAISYKVRLIFGGSHSNATGGWRGTYRSTGAGS